MEQFQQQNDIKPEAFLNPENIPPVPVSEKENQQEILNVNLDYQMMLAGVLFDKAVRPNMTAEEIDLLAEMENNTVKRESPEYSAVVAEKHEPDNFFAKLIMDPPRKEEEITPEMFTEQAEDARKYALKEKGGKEDVVSLDRAKTFTQEELSSQMSVFSRAVELVKDYLKKHPKLEKAAMVGVVASELAGCATAPNMIYTGMNGVMQAGQAEMSGNMNANMNANMEKMNADINYNTAMQNAELNRKISYANLDGERQQMIAYGTDPQQVAANITSRSIQIEGQYQREVGYAQAEFQRQTMYAQANYARTRAYADADRQRIIGYTIQDVTRQALNGVMQGVRGHGGHW
jgi:hypothetical protein